MGKRREKKRIYGTAERPRLSVYASLNHIYAQVINDDEGKTLASASTLDPDLKKKLKKSANLEAAKEVGSVLAERAIKAGIKKVVFDRGERLYHGKIKALADSAREKGLQF
jgi:large subunit ribosomal protein L18